VYDASTKTWEHIWLAPLSPDGETYQVRARVTDLAGHVVEVSEAVGVDFVLPSHMDLELYTNGEPLAASSTVASVHPALRIEWPEATDGSGIRRYYAGWTSSPEPDLDALSVCDLDVRSHTQTIESLMEVFYAHVGAQDSFG